MYRGLGCYGGAFDDINPSQLLEPIRKKFAASPEMQKLRDLAYPDESELMLMREGVDENE